MDKPLRSKVAVDSEADHQIPSVVTEDEQAVRESNKDSHKKGVVAATLSGIVGFVLDFIETIVVALSIFVVVYLFLVQPHEVRGSSMEPNFHNNEYILTDKISYRIHNPNRGDVIIFKSPQNPDVDYIKRIVGLPGDRVMVKNGYVYVNGIKLNEYYLKDLTLLFPGSFVQEGVEIAVPSNDYFVMGDNRPHSSDSREFGPIDKKSIIGKALIRYWPPQMMGVIPGISYDK